MGACDLVLLSAPNSVDNKDLTLLARTTIRYAYSFIETAAIKIGDSVLEVSSFGQHSLDGVDNALAASDGGRLTLDDYPISYKKVDEKKHVFEIVLSESETITLYTFKDLVGIRMSNEASREFFGTDATGIMGSMDGKLLGRDGVTDMSADTDAFGQEWQVRPEVDGNFFQKSRAPQYPEKCIMPSATTKQVRRLGESSLQVEAAETACGRFSGDRFENCIYDGNYFLFCGMFPCCCCTSHLSSSFSYGDRRFGSCRRGSLLGKKQKTKQTRSPRRYIPRCRDEITCREDTYLIL